MVSLVNCDIYVNIIEENCDWVYHLDSRPIDFYFIYDTLQIVYRHVL
jgi:hypothetical protein